MNKRIIDCTLQLIENQKSECQWNDKLTQQEDFECFQKVLIERSEIIRKYYNENEALLQTLKDYIEGPMDDEKAETLFEAARQTILTGRIDPPLTMLLAEPIIDYYISKDNKERAICAIIFYGTTAQDYYSRNDNSMFKDKLIHNYEWVIENSKYYCTYKDYRARNNTILAYVNYIFLLSDSADAKYLDKILQLYGELQALWKSKEVQALDGNNENVKNLFETNSYYALLEICEYFVEFGQDVSSQVIDWLKEFYLAHKEDTNWQKTIKNLQIHIENLEHHINSVQSVQGWVSLIDEIPTPDWNGDMELAQEIFELSSDTLVRALIATKKTTHMNMDEKERMVTTLLHTYERFIDKLPYAYLSSYVNAVFRLIFVHSLPCVTKMKYKEQIFHELLIRRQPSTFLHSRMVEEISVLIAEEILDKEPKLFLSLPFYNSVEDILAHKEELLDIIARGARLHDAGKCSIASVIMTQSRKLTDDEFFLIKSHPDRGYDFFKGTENFDVYADIIRGHHKNYDGSWGYPADFDNTASPYRILIDLISISDSTDAATDTLGRNYAVGKDFYRLLGELQEGAGSRYNPDIVRIISDSPKLSEQLAKLTGSLRIQYCYEAYRQCMQLR